MVDFYIKNTSFDDVIVDSGRIASLTLRRDPPIIQIGLNYALVRLFGVSDTKRF